MNSLIKLGAFKMMYRETIRVSQVETCFCIDGVLWKAV